jgi:hypothetical protein
MPPVMGVPPGHAPILYCISGQKSNGGRIWVVVGNPTTSDFEDAVREHGKVLAQHKQWIEGHDAHVHPALEKRVESVATKTNAFAWIDTALSLLAGLLAGLKLR